MGKPNSFCFLLLGPCYIFIYKNICLLQTRHFWVLHLLFFRPIHFCIREGSLDLLSLLFHVVSLPASHPLKLKLRFLKFVLSCSRDGFSLYQQAQRLLTTLQMNLEIKNPNQKPKPHLGFYGGATGLTGFIFSLNASRVVTMRQLSLGTR